jgi:N-acyl homoserine lactone hydrolase
MPVRLAVVLDLALGAGVFCAAGSEPVFSRRSTMRAAAILSVSVLVWTGTVGAQTTLKLYEFDCGRLRFESVEAFGVGDDETPVRELIVPCYVVEHERGRLLWDGGLPSELASEAGWRQDGNTGMRLDRTLAAQLADMSLGMDAFDYVAFSHMHFDHVGVANEVSGATLIIQEEEYDAAFADEITVFSYDPGLYGGLADLETIIARGEHDVFGDGSVRILPAPGHTPGHQVLFIALENTGPVVLSGDLYHFRLSREDRRVPGFNVDRDMTLASMADIEAFLRDTGAQLWIEHDLARFEASRHAPSFYD